MHFVIVLRILLCLLWYYFVVCMLCVQLCDNEVLSHLCVLWVLN